MTNEQLASLFVELADILEIAGENHFKILSYRKAAVALSELDESIGELSSEQIRAVPGIGKAIADKTKTALQEGTFPTLEQWRQSNFSPFLPLTRIPGITPRKIGILIKRLTISSLDDMKKAIDNGRFDDIDIIDRKTKKAIMEYLMEKER